MNSSDELNITEKINDIDRNILRYNNDISKKKEDVVNSEVFLGQFKKCLSNQNEALMKLFEEIQNSRDRKEELRETKEKSREQNLKCILDNINSQNLNLYNEIEKLQTNHDFMTTIEIIDRNILTYMDMFSNQKEEITKTDALILTFQNNLVTQNESINRLIEEVQGLRDQKETLRNMMSAIREKSIKEKLDKLKINEESDKDEMLKEIQDLRKENDNLKLSTLKCVCKERIIVDESYKTQENMPKRTTSIHYSGLCPTYPILCCSAHHFDPRQCHHIMSQYYGKKYFNQTYFCCPYCQTVESVPYDTFFSNHNEHLIAFSHLSKKDIFSRMFFDPTSSPLRDTEFTLEQETMSVCTNFTNNNCNESMDKVTKNNSSILINDEGHVLRSELISTLQEKQLPKNITRISKNVAGHIKEFASGMMDRIVTNNGQFVPATTYVSQTLIPNKFKFSTFTRQARVIHLSSSDNMCLFLHEILSTTVRNVVHLHIAEGKTDLFSRTWDGPIDNKEILLDWQTSWEFSIDLLRRREFLLKPRRLPLTLYMEIIEKDFSPYPQELDVYDDDITQELEEEHSVVWSTNRECVFLAARFAFNKLIALPLQIVLLNNGGDAEMDTFVCPRTKVINYASEHHAINESTVLGQLDEYSAYNILRDKIRNKIVVGYGIYKILTRLRIKFSDIGGLRELRTGHAFGSLTQTKYHWHLDRLADSYLGAQIRMPIRNAYDEADLVRRLYLVVENRWMDDLVCEKSRTNEKASAEGSSLLLYKPIEEVLEVTDIKEEDMEFNSDRLIEPTVKDNVFSVTILIEPTLEHQEESSEQNPSTDKFHRVEMEDLDETIDAEIPIPKQESVDHLTEDDVFEYVAPASYHSCQEETQEEVQTDELGSEHSNMDTSERPSNPLNDCGAEGIVKDLVVKDDFVSDTESIKCYGLDMENPDFVYNGRTARTSGQKSLDDPIRSGECSIKNEVEELPKLPGITRPIFDSRRRLQEVKTLKSLYKVHDDFCCKPNGFWIPPWSKRNDKKINNGVFKWMAFFPPCHIRVQFYIEPTKHLRLRYADIPMIQMRTDDDYFEVFYVPQKLENMNRGRWINFKQYIFTEGRDYSVIRERYTQIYAEDCRKQRTKSPGK